MTSNHGQNTLSGHKNSLHACMHIGHCLKLNCKGNHYCIFSLYAFVWYKILQRYYLVHCTKYYSLEIEQMYISRFQRSKCLINSVILDIELTKAPVS